MNRLETGKCMMDNEKRKMKIFQMVPNGPKWFQIFLNDTKWLQILPNDTKRFQMVPNCKNGQTNYQKFNIVQKGPNGHPC